MTAREKVALVSEVVDEVSLSVALDALELPRSTWYYHQQHVTHYKAKHADLRIGLEAIATEHPEYGYRRVGPELKEVHGRIVNQKLIRRLHRLWDMPVLRRVRRPKPSGIYEAIQAAGKRANRLAALEPEGIVPFAFPPQNSI